MCGPKSFGFVVALSCFVFHVTAASQVESDGRKHYQFGEEAIATRIQAESSRIDQKAAEHGGWDSWFETILRVWKRTEEDLNSDPDIVRDGQFVYLPNGYLYDKGWLKDWISGGALENTRNGSAALQSIVRTRDWLSELGVHLIVIPIPPREEVTPESVFSESLELPHLAHFIGSLLAHQVDTVNVLPSLKQLQSDLGKSMSLKLDSHYSNYGVQVVANEIAAALSVYENPEINSVEKGYTTQVVQFGLLPAPLKYLSEGSQIHVPSVENAETQRVIDKDGDSFKQLDEAKLLLIGDSYTYVFQEVEGHLAAHIALKTNMDVSHIGISGGAATVPSRLARLGKDKVQKYEVVIWTFGARYLTREGWDRNPLQAAK